MKRCPRCLATKPLSEFYKDPTKASGVKSHCKACCLADPADAARYQREWRKANPGKARAIDRRKREKRSNHGGPDEWARMFEAQAGCCYLCRRPLLPGQDIHVDHDHTHCPGGRVTRSCPACRRGLAHAACNQIWGLAMEDPGLLRTIAEEGKLAADAARERIAAAARTLQPLW